MPLDKQIARVDFTGGLETKQDERLVVPGKLLTLQNAAFEEAGSLRRRDGLFGSVGTSPTTHRGLGLLNDELLVQAGSALYSFSDTGDTFSSRGVLPNATVQRRPLLPSGGWQDYFDVASISGYTCVIYREQNVAAGTYALRIAVLDEPTGAVVLTPTDMSTTGFRPRLVAVTGAFIAFYYDAGNLLRARVIQTSAPTTLGAETTLRTDTAAGTVSVIDACSDGANAFVVYASNDATYSLRAIRVTRSGTTPSVASGPADILAVATVADTDIRAAAIAVYTSSLIGVFFLVDDSVAAAFRGMWSAVVTDTMAISAAATRQDASAVVVSADAQDPHITACLNGSNMRVYSDHYNSNGGLTAVTNIRVTVLDSTNAVVTSPANFVLGSFTTDGFNGPFISGKAVTLGSETFLPAKIRSMGPTPLQDSWYLLNQSGAVVGKALYGSLGKPFQVNEELTCSTLTTSATSAAVLSPEIRLLSFQSGFNVSLTGMCRLDWSVTTSLNSIRQSVGGEAYFAGGSLSAYDGAAITEAAFLLFPEHVTATSGGAGNVPALAHQIVALYEWIDGAGQRHQSAPSVAITYNNAGATTVTVAVQTTFLTQKAAFIGVVVYATPLNSTTFYRVNSVAAPVYNTTGAATVNVTYNLSDASLQTGELLYTTGGILPNNSPPPCTMCMVHQGRLFIDSETVGEFRYSQPSVPGFGLQWNENLNGRLTYPNEALTGMVSIDDKALFFSAERPYVLVGRGPATTGAQNGYELFEVTADVGCTEPRSLVRFPGGVLFKSRKGWYVMDRGLNARYIGSAVAEFDSQNVTSAVLCGDKHEIRITTSTSDGVMLVYNYDEDQWATYQTSTSMLDAVWWTNTERYVWINNATAVRQETPGTRTDASGAGVVVEFQTAWLHLGEAIHGFQRVWRMILTGAKIGTHVSELEVVAEYDYGDGNFSSRTVTVPDTTVLSDAGAVGEVTWVFRWHMPIQKCAAVRFTITDTPATNSAGLYGFTSLTLEVGVKKGARKFRAGQSF